MTGFIRGLFRRKQNQPPQPAQPGNAFFLTPDDSKSFGDIDYMRTSKTIRRTFAKKKGQTEEQARIKSVSALSSTNGLAPGDSFLSAIAEAKIKADGDQTQVDRKKTDTNLDMFRKMARDMNK